MHRHRHFERKIVLGLWVCAARECFAVSARSLNAMARETVGVAGAGDTGGVQYNVHCNHPGNTPKLYWQWTNSIRTEYDLQT